MAATPAQIMEYFTKYVQSYSCGDVRALITADLGVCGPLLACTVNGIDFVGGMISGFGRGTSRRRSVAFLEVHLAVPTDQAQLLYDIVRCGISHEGVTKPGVGFFTCERRHKQGCFLYRLGSSTLHLNVTELARCYLEAVEKIASAPLTYLHHVPPDSPAPNVGLVALAAPRFEDFIRSLPPKYPVESGSGGDIWLRDFRTLAAGDQATFRAVVVP